MISRYLLQQLNELRRQKVYCDLELISSDKQLFPIHQVVFTALNKRNFQMAILSADSGVYEVFTKKRMLLSCVNSIELRQLIEFMYGQPVTDRARLLTTLKKLRMDDLEDVVDDRSENNKTKTSEAANTQHLRETGETGIVENKETTVKLKESDVIVPDIAKDKTMGAVNINTCIQEQKIEKSEVDPNNTTSAVHVSNDKELANDKQSIESRGAASDESTKNKEDAPCPKEESELDEKPNVLNCVPNHLPSEPIDNSGDDFVTVKVERQDSVESDPLSTDMSETVDNFTFGLHEFYDKDDDNEESTGMKLNVVIKTEAEESNEEVNKYGSGIDSGNGESQSKAVMGNDRLSELQRGALNSGLELFKRLSQYPEVNLALKNKSQLDIPNTKQSENMTQSKFGNQPPSAIRHGASYLSENTVKEKRGPVGSLRLRPLFKKQNTNRTNSLTNPKVTRHGEGNAKQPRKQTLDKLVDNSDEADMTDEAEDDDHDSPIKKVLPVTSVSTVDGVHVSSSNDELSNKKSNGEPLNSIDVMDETLDAEDTKAAARDKFDKALQSSLGIKKVITEKKPANAERKSDNVEENPDKQDDKPIVNAPSYWDGSSKSMILFPLPVPPIPPHSVVHPNASQNHGYKLEWVMDDVAWNDQFLNKNKGEDETTNKETDGKDEEMSITVHEINEADPEINETELRADYMDNKISDHTSMESLKKRVTKVRQRSLSLENRKSKRRKSVETEQLTEQDSDVETDDDVPLLQLKRLLSARSDISDKSETLSDTGKEEIDNNLQNSNENKTMKCEPTVKLERSNVKGSELEHASDTIEDTLSAVDPSSEVKSKLPKRLNKMKRRNSRGCLNSAVSSTKRAKTTREKSETATTQQLSQTPELSRILCKQFLSFRIKPLDFRIGQNCNEVINLDELDMPEEENTSDKQVNDTKAESSDFNCPSSETKVDSSEKGKAIDSDLNCSTITKQAKTDIKKEVNNMDSLKAQLLNPPLGMKVSGKYGASSSGMVNLQQLLESGAIKPVPKTQAYQQSPVLSPVMYAPVISITTVTSSNSPTLSSKPVTTLSDSLPFSLPSSLSAIEPLSASNQKSSTGFVLFTPKSVALPTTKPEITSSLSSSPLQTHLSIVPPTLAKTSGSPLQTGTPALANPQGSPLQTGTPTQANSIGSPFTNIPAKATTPMTNKPVTYVAIPNPNSIDPSAKFRKILPKPNVPVTIHSVSPPPENKSKAKSTKHVKRKNKKGMLENKYDVFNV